mgnify:CR=1 FL=1
MAFTSNEAENPGLLLCIGGKERQLLPLAVMWGPASTRKIKCCKQEVITIGNYKYKSKSTSIG